MAIANFLLDRTSATLIIFAVYGRVGRHRNNEACSCGPAPG